ncbi:unnamed protein product [Camellia sinensis]
MGTLIHGAETFKNIFREGLNMESLEEELILLGIGAKRLNLKHVRGMLLYGPPGSGKTLIARSICKLLNAKEPLIVNGPDVLNAFQGVSERKIRSLFKAANEDENRYVTCISSYLIKLIRLLRKRGVAMGQYHMDDSIEQYFYYCYYNRKELIDEALLREGRIELHVKLEYPDERGHLQILDINTRNMRQAFVLDEDVNLQDIACMTDGCSGSALASLVTRVHSYAVVQAGERGLVKHVKKDVKIFSMEKEEMILQQFSSSNLTEVLHIQQDIARLKKDSAYFQATLACYKEDTVKLEKELETLRCALDHV